MKKTTTITVEVEKVQIDDILCNACGKSCKDRSDMNFEGLIETSITGGYASKLGDQITYTFSICEDCLEKLFESFKIPAEEFDSLGFRIDDQQSLRAEVGAIEKILREIPVDHLIDRMGLESRKQEIEELLVDFNDQ